MNTRVQATINGQAHGLQFHSVHIRQRLFEPLVLRLDLGFGEHEAEDVLRKVTDTWLGAELAVVVKDELDGNIQKKYAGTIVSFTISSVAVQLEARTKDHLLAAGRKHKTFFNVKLNDVVTQVIQATGVQADIQGPGDSKQFRFLQQYDESDYDLLLRAARFDGAVFFHDGEKFYYKKSLDAISSVTLGLEDVDEVQLGGTLELTKWKGSYYNHEKHLDPGAGYVSPAKDPLRSQGPIVSNVHKKADSVFSGQTDEVYHSPLFAQNDMTAFVSAIDRQSAGNLVRVKGETHHPMVAIGRSVSCSAHALLKNPSVVVAMDAHFEGNVYSAGFEAIPEKAIVSPPDDRQTRRSGTELQPAAVVDNKDPEKIGRVKVRYNWSDQEQTYWARVVSAGAGGPAHGTYFLPRVGDQVLVGFENGDPSLPVVLGALYHNEAKPKFLTDNGTEEVLVAKTPISTIRIIEKQGAEEVIVSMKDTINILHMESSQPQITLESVGGTILIKSKDIKITADNKLEIKAKDIEINADQSMQTTVGKDHKLTIKGDATESVTGKKDITVGGNFKENVTSNKEITAGGDAKVKSSANAELSGTVKATVSGAQVESSAVGTNTIKGATVMIN
jgi:type VI secretion system secreted protein VgrG